MSEITKELGEILGDAGVVTASDLASRATSYWDSSPTIAKALVRPASTQQLSDVMHACSRAGQTVSIEGGRTGVVGGAVSTAEDIIISLEKMNAIESVDGVDGTAIVQCGATLQNVQERLQQQGLLFPLDLGARGSCTIGGNIATNAGGVNVLRYGMTRNLVLGLEAVLADGTVVSSMNRMMKNNTGYDLKQLFIGSEGTLGIVTRAVLKLQPLPKSRQTVLFATKSFDSVTAMLKTLRGELAGTLSAYEVMWQNYYRAVTGNGGHSSPLSRDYPYYVLAEAEGADPVADDKRWTEVIEQGFANGNIVDAVLPKSIAERDAFWGIREDFDIALPAHLYDVSLPISAMTTYMQRVNAALMQWREDAVGLVFGHIADGNLHIFVRPFEKVDKERCDQIIYCALDGLDGSVSAEHGIGTDKKQWLNKTRSSVEIKIMQDLKRLFDPHGILNPGKVVD